MMNSVSVIHCNSSAICDVDTMKFFKVFKSLKRPNFMFFVIFCAIFYNDLKYLISYISSDLCVLL